MDDRCWFVDELGSVFSSIISESDNCCIPQQDVMPERKFCLCLNKSFSFVTTCLSLVSLYTLAFSTTMLPSKFVFHLYLLVYANVLRLIQCTCQQCTSFEKRHVPDMNGEKCYHFQYNYVSQQAEVKMKLHKGLYFYYPPDTQVMNRRKIVAYGIQCGTKKRGHFEFERKKAVWRYLEGVL